MANTGNPVQRRRPDGWWYPWTFVGGMLVVIAVNALMLTLAIETFPGLQTEDAYGKGLKYNQTLAAAETQRQLGWQAEMSVLPRRIDSAESYRGASIAVKITDAGGQPLADLLARAFLTRPAVKGHDTEMLLNYRGDGTYTGEVALPLPGLWDVRIHAHRGTDNFQIVRRVNLP